MAKKTITDEEIKESWLALRALVADMSSEWWDVQLHLGMLFAALARTRTKVAWAILSTMTSTRLQRDVVLNTAGLVLAKKADFLKVERILKRVGTASHRRNQFAHSAFSAYPSIPLRLRVMSMSGNEDPALIHYEAYSASDLRNFVSQFKMLSMDVQALAFEMRKARRRPSGESHGPPRKYRSIPSVTLS
jgi:hypothetical protein